MKQTYARTAKTAQIKTRSCLFILSINKLKLEQKSLLVAPPSK
jgi:hypothetical protein